jgi:tight adherence protein C
MISALGFGLLAGLGLWVSLVALKPQPAPLGQALADLHRPSTQATTTARRSLAARLLTLLASLGIHTAAREQQLALAGISPEAWAREKLLGALAGLALPLAVLAALAAAGLSLPAAAAVLAVAVAAAGWWLPDVKLKERVTRRRKAFQYALSAYLDLVNVILAGGGGIETALVAAADAGDGWAFAKLRHALHRAQRINQPLWTAFDDLGAELGVAELRDLASSLGLAGAQGARIRASLAVKADTLRTHQIAETEAAAEATTERMNLPTAVLLLGFLLFIVFPAVTAITGVSEPPCPPGTEDCPATQPPTGATPTGE